MGILSSMYPTIVSYPSTETDGMAVAEAGLPAFLELNNIGWLFVLCIILFFVGIFIAIYPKLCAYRAKK